MERVIFFRRLTVFTVNFVNFTQEVREKLNRVFPSASVAPFINSGEGFIAPQPLMAAPPMGGEGVPWQLFSMELTFRFVPNSINVISQNVTINKEDEETLVRKMHEALCRMLQSLSIERVLLMAYAPSIAVDETPDFLVNDYFKKVMRVPTVGEAVPQHMDLRVSYIQKKKLRDDREESLTCVCKLDQGKKRDQQARMDIPCVIMEADLNMRNPENAYTMGDLDAFFAQSIDWAEVFVDAFLKG